MESRIRRLWLAAGMDGFAEITGLRGLARWARGDKHIDPEAEAQGPARRQGTALDTGGPFELSRHPLNLSPLPVRTAGPMTATAARCRSTSRERLSDR